MATVRALTYIGLKGPDLDAWRSFATDVLGMQIADNSTDDRLLLRLDDRAQRITVERGDPGLAFLGFELATRQELDDLVEHLRADGLDVIDDPELAAVRQVRHLVRCSDPAGNSVELVVGQLSATGPFISPRGVTFKTADQGLGHAVMLVPNLEQAWHFYADLLGFRLSDTIDLGFSTLSFMHCNPRHHTLAMGELPGVSALAHFMVEVTELADVGRAFDIAVDQKLEIVATLGMHTNDHMLSFYVRTPSGFEVEYGTNGRAIDDATWTVGHYNAASYWGHRRDGMPAG